jgi:SHS2 domain-containing protein
VIAVDASRDSSARAGHRVAPHVADAVLEAWGTSRVACLEEAALALVELFAEAGAVAPRDRIPVSIQADDDEDLLVSLLEEMIYTMDVAGAVPVGVELAEDAGGVVGFFATVPPEELEIVGALPKGVSRSGLQFAPHRGQWRCRVLVDV